MMTANRFLIWGKTGWIGDKLVQLLAGQGKVVNATSVRMENQAEVHQVLDSIEPTHVINCAGKTGRPNVDWCETHKLETVEANVTGTLVLAKACKERKVHLTTLATGCIYSSTYDDKYEKILSKPFKETDRGNFEGSFYSYTKSRVEDVLKMYDNCLILRLRMPVSDDLHDRSFVTKILKYQRIVDIQNSHSILTELLPVVVAMAEHKETGVVNFTNPGAISHTEVLELYKKIVDSKCSWTTFTLKEQSAVIKADRSNCQLDCSKLLGIVENYNKEGYGLEVLPIHEAYEKCFRRMKENIQLEAGAEQMDAS